MVGRLSHVKGVDLALRAFAGFVASHRDRPAVLVLAGAGPDESMLKALASELGIAEHVRWLGFVPEPMKVYHALDVLVLPSRVEGLPLAMLEAMACGVIPIASDVGGVCEVIEDASMGWLIPPGQVEPIVAAMSAVASLTASQRDAFRSRLPEHVRSQFNEAQCIDHLLDAAGLTEPYAWNRPFIGSKLRDMADAYVEFARLWAACHLGRPRRPGATASSTTPPPVCIIEESQGWGGGENHTYQLIEHLLRRGHVVEHVRARNSLPNPPDGVKRIASPVGVMEDGGAVLRAWRSVLAGVTSDIAVLPALDVAFGMSGAFNKAMRERFSRITYIEHTLPPPTPGRNPKRYFGGRIAGPNLNWRREQLRRRLRMRCPTQVITVSEAVREGFVRDWHCPPEKVHTVRNGVDCERFAVSAAQREAARAAHGLPPEGVMFGVMARLSVEKGVDLAVRAFAAYRALRPQRPAMLLVAGDGPEAAALQQLSVELNVAADIRWAGYVRDPTRVFPAMDVLLATSRVEGLPLALLEAMAGGVIPIVSLVGGMPEVVSRPDLGWVVEPGDIDGVAKAMVAVSQLSADALEAQSLRVRDWVRQHFNIRDAHAQITRIITGE